MECVCCQNVFEVVSNNDTIIMSNTSNNSGPMARCTGEFMQNSSAVREKENKMS